MKPKIVIFCGSSKFVDIMAICAWLVERDENKIALGLHLLPWWYSTKCSDHLAEAEGVAEKMDALHFKKIEMSDEIFVINYDDYIGDSTRREIEHAKSLGIPRRWFTHDPVGVACQTMITAAISAVGGG